MSDNWGEERRQADRRAADRRGGDRRVGDRRGGIWVGGNARIHIGLFLFVVACIVYGTLYPYQSYDRADNIGAVVVLLSTAGDWNHPSHLVASILAYTPFAFFAMFALPTGIYAQLRVMMTFAGGTLLSAWLALAQYQELGHATAMADVYASGIGLVIGIVLALIAQGQRATLMRDLSAGRVQAVLLIMWAGDRLYPYVPVSGGIDIWHAVAPLLDWSSIDPIKLARACVRWLMVACVVDSMVGMRRWFRWFPLLILAESAARLLLVGRALSPYEVGGAVASLLVWPLLRWLPISRVLLLGAFAALVIVVRLAPFHFMGIPGTFGWLPFKAMLGGSAADMARAVFSDGFLYGGLIWLLTIGGVGVGGATALTAAMLLALSIAQSWQPGRTGEITDAVVALAIGGVLALLQDDKTGSYVRAPPPGAERSMSRRARDSEPAA